MNFRNKIYFVDEENEFKQLIWLWVIAFAISHSFSSLLSLFYLHPFFSSFPETKWVSEWSEEGRKWLKEEWDELHALRSTQLNLINEMHCAHAAITFVKLN